MTRETAQAVIESIETHLPEIAADARARAGLTPRNYTEFCAWFNLNIAAGEADPTGEESYQ